MREITTTTAMETSLRYGGNINSLRIHAKEKFNIEDFSLQVQGELDTYTGAPCYGAVLARYFDYAFGADLVVGMHYTDKEKFGYTVRAKKSFSMSENGSFRFNVKGRWDTDMELEKRKARGAAELSWSIFNFTEDQDVRIKLGYEVFDKVPYLQIRENNWTLNADIEGKWNVRFDL